jgi:lysophospholipase L1-like esterase
MIFVGTNGRYGIKRGILLPVVAFIMILVASAAAIKIVINPDFSVISSSSSNSSVASGIGSSKVPSSSISVVSKSSSSSKSSLPSSSSKVAAVPGDYSYLIDAVFIGDSLTSGIKEYSITKNAGVFSTNGMSTAQVMNTKVTLNSVNMPLTNALANIKPAKVYILLGSNDVVWMKQATYITNYGNLIDAVIKSLPNATIYIQSIFPVTAAYEKENIKDNLNNEKINIYNQALLNLCSNKNVKYLDVASVLKGSDGKLPDSAGSDGFNIKRSTYVTWFNFLVSHQ